MSWSFDTITKVWHCTLFSDLQYAEINNFAEYGQPVSPYQPGYDHNHVPDFDNIVIEMPLQRNAELKRKSAPATTIGILAPVPFTLSSTPPWQRSPAPTTIT